MSAIDSVLAVETNPRLRQSIQRAASARLSADELLAQRVSFVYGSMDRNSNVTKERVREVIIGLSGGTAAK